MFESIDIVSTLNVLSTLSLLEPDFLKRKNTWNSGPYYLLALDSIGNSAAAVAFAAARF